MLFKLTLPKLSPTMEEGTVAKWHKKEGEFVTAGEVIFEVTTDKATVEHQALDEGWLRKILIKEGQFAKVNQPIALFSTEKDENIEQVESEEKKPSPVSKKPAQKKELSSAPAPLSFSQPAFVPEPPLPLSLQEETTSHFASPLARKKAREQGLDLTSVKGSGPGGRVKSQDLEKAQPQALLSFGHKESPSTPPGTYEEIPLTPMRKAIGKRLQEAKSFIPHFYVKQRVDALALMELRKQLNFHKIQISVNDLLIRACALALRKHPEVNSGFNSVNQTLIQFKTIDISVAVSIEGGLITPIIRHADFKDLGQISAEVKELAERARSGKLKEYEYKGGSFTLSNLGMFGLSEFCAVLNPPQAAILAVGAIEEQPSIKEGKVVAGQSLILTLSADHRVIDGATAAQFIKSVQQFLENPALLVM